MSNGVVGEMSGDHDDCPVCGAAPFCCNCEEVKPAKIEKRRWPDAKIVNIASGGFVSLTLRISLFELSEEDRQFVFGLIEAMNRYAALCGDETSGPCAVSVEEGR